MEFEYDNNNENQDDGEFMQDNFENEINQLFENNEKQEDFKTKKDAVIFVIDCE